MAEVAKNNPEIEKKEQFYRKLLSVIFSILGLAILGIVIYVSFVPKHTEVVIPAGTEVVADRLYYNRADLAKISIADSVTKIDNWAFYGCENVAEITIPANVVEIGWGVFSGVKKVNVAKANKVFEVDNSGALYNKLTKTLVYCPPRLKGVYEVRPGTEKIECYAFAFCSALTEVKIPASVKEIGSGAFFSCAKLEKADFPAAVTVYKRSVFENCAALKAVNFSAAVTDIEYFAFRGCNALKQINIPDNIREIAVYAFDECENLKEVSLLKVKGVGKAGDINKDKGVIVGHNAFSKEVKIRPRLVVPVEE